MTFFPRTAMAALAVCMAAPAVAQSSVQLYGRINTALEYQSYGGHDVTGLRSNDALLGFKGKEDLGRGHHAGFVLEMALESDSGAAGNVYGQDGFRRHSELQLGGPWGLLRMGAFDQASYTSTVHAVQWHTDRFAAGSDMFGWGDLYRGNTVAYRTPTWAGWQAEVQRRLGENAVDDGWRDKGQWDLGLNYRQGAWGLGLGYNRDVVDFVGRPGGSVDTTTTLRADYTAGAWRVGGYYQWVRLQQDMPNQSVDRLDINTARLAVAYRQGRSEWHASVGRESLSSNDGWAGQSHVQWTLGYNHHLSARTQLYATLSHLQSMPARTMYDALWAQYDEAHSLRSAALGVRHSF